MAVSRYVRAVGFDLTGTGDLELSEVSIYQNGARVDASATLTAYSPPSQGSLADLRDGATTGVATWALSEHSAPRFALVWDFGVGGGVEYPQIQLGAGSSKDTFPLSLILQLSTDATNWVTYGGATSITYPGALTLTGAPASTASAPPYDLDFNYVTLLLRADGAHGATTTPNTGAVTNAVTLVAATVSTTQFKFGSASIYVPTYSAGIGIPASVLGLNGFDFTIDVWHRPDVLTLWRTIFEMNPNDGNGPNLVVQSNQNNTANLEFKGRVNGAGNFNVVNAAGSMVAGAWNHVAIVRAGTTLNLYVNGLKGPTVTIGSADTFSTYASNFGGRTSGAGSAGYYDDMRITIGLARYTSNFAVPTVPHYPAPPPGGIIQQSLLHRFRSSAPLVQGLLPAVELPVPTAQGHLREYPFFDAYNGGIGIVYGTTKEKHSPANTPLRRKVLLLDECSQMVIRETWSDAATGAFEFRGVKQGVPYTVISYDHTGAYRAVIADAQIPELIV